MCPVIKLTIMSMICRLKRVGIPCRKGKTVLIISERNITTLVEFRVKDLDVIQLMPQNMIQGKMFQ